MFNPVFILLGKVSLKRIKSVLIYCLSGRLILLIGRSNKMIPKDREQPVFSYYIFCRIDYNDSVFLSASSPIGLFMHS